MKRPYMKPQIRKVAGAAIDVFEREPATDNPLCKLPNVIVTPHLGASTTEAQVNVAVQVAEQVLNALYGGPLVSAVNMPIVPPDTMSVIRPFVPLMRTLGSLYTQLFDGKVEKLEIIYGGEISGYPVSTLTTSFLIGMLSVILKETVNYVNAPLIAKQRGIKIREITSSTADNFTNLVTVHVKTADGVKTLAGTIFNDKDIRIVQIDKYRIEVVPSRYMLVATYNDMPGVIGRFGIILGDSNINIAGMQVPPVTGRRSGNGSSGGQPGAGRCPAAAAGN